MMLFGLREEVLMVLWSQLLRAAKVTLPIILNATFLQRKYFKLRQRIPIQGVFLAFLDNLQRDLNLLLPRSFFFPAFHGRSCDVDNYLD